MCFSFGMSTTFAVIGLALAIWIHIKTSNRLLAIGVFYFFSMEALQAVQYLFLATSLTDSVCSTMINKVLTILGFAHICFQPYFCHIMNEALSMKPNPKNTPEHNNKLYKYHYQYMVIKRLCIIGGVLMFLRWPMSYFAGWNTVQVPNVEWLRGTTVCTFKTQSMWHLGWSVPMADGTYNVQGTGIHSFLMFAPFFALYEKRGMMLQGLVLYLSGPFMASLFTSNMMEQASIWCFFSIAQITIMLFLIRETLIVNWGTAKSNFSLQAKNK